MKKYNFEEHVVPRPVELLPEYAHAKARQSCAERLSQAFKLPDDVAKNIANTVVDPTTVRKNIGDYNDPNFEEIPVSGGMLMGIRTMVWSRRIMPDPRNPRIGPSRKHPFAVEPGSGEEDSRFRPIPEPSSPGDDSRIPLLAVNVENRHHLKWALEQAKLFVMAENNWSDSIASQGVMEHIWLVPTVYRHADGSDPVFVLTSAEGSSRTTAVHNLLDIQSADVPYEDNDNRLRNGIRKANQTYQVAQDLQSGVALRCERVPALILLGFRPHGDGETGFPTAVKSLVALRHVDPPKPWGDGPEHEALADEVLDELLRRHLISQTKHDYFAGTLTRREAAEAHMSPDPAIRAAHIVRLFASTDAPHKAAIRTAITSQSTRKNITSKLCDELATALILRAHSGDRSNVDQVRRYLKEAFGMASHREAWTATDRPIDVLERDALTEIQHWNATGQRNDPGPSSLELAVRAAYPLVVSGRLNADRGSNGNPQPDRRVPGEVLDAMRRRVHGIYQLSQACKDYLDGLPLRAVDESGVILLAEDGETERTINDIYLRNTFPPFGKAPAPTPGDSPLDVLKHRTHDFAVAIEAAQAAFIALSNVVGDDSRPLVETYGIESHLCSTWRSVLTEIQDELAIFDHIFRRKHGGARRTNLKQAPDESQSDIPLTEKVVI